ncbi:MAG TPA: hypothetical protein VFG30_28485 [Polyangiales bacterium]|nr:hypothetical protein [Polyangiales bacterium]
MKRGPLGTHRLSLSLAALVVAVSATACSDDDGQPGDASVDHEGPLTLVEQRLVEAVVSQSEQSLSQAVSGASLDEIVAEFNVLGSNVGAYTNAHLAIRCEGPRMSAPTCLVSIPGTGLVGCFRDGCTSPTSSFVDVYVTDPDHESAEDRVPISYTATVEDLAGTVTYTPNPLVRWNSEFTPDGARVSADIDETVVVELESGNLVDGSHAGRLEGTRVVDDVHYTLVLALPRLSSAGELTITLQNGSSIPRTGEIKLGDLSIAEVAETQIVWE